jgi:hypothetical protein
MLKGIHRVSLIAVIAVLAASFLGSAAWAQAPIWPVSNHPYNCSWSKPDPNNPGTQLTGTAVVTFVDLAGNDYLRRGTLRNLYPTGALTETPVTVTKPVPLYPGTTQFELTTGTGIQCKDFETLGNAFYLFFGSCSNGAQQWCSY